MSSSSKVRGDGAGWKVANARYVPNRTNGSQIDRNLPKRCVPLWMSNTVPSPYAVSNSCCDVSHRPLPRPFEDSNEAKRAAQSPGQLSDGTKRLPAQTVQFDLLQWKTHLSRVLMDVKIKIANFIKKILWGRNWNRLKRYYKTSSSADLMFFLNFFTELLGTS